MSAEVWEQVYDRLAELIEAHRTTLVFVNTRRMAERVARQLSERLGEAAVTAHHGSLAKEQRLRRRAAAEGGQLKALVATASLELGIDIGDVDLVCQLGSPRAIATFLQRVGRSGHAVGGTAQGPAVPAVARRAGGMRRAARCRAPRRAGPADHSASAARRAGAADRGRSGLRRNGARTSCSRWCGAPGPTATCEREDFDAVVHMLAEGFATRRGRRGAYLHRDAVNHMLRGRRGARLTAITSGGAIPDNADYQVVLEPREPSRSARVNEDFAIESLAGDVFQLGNSLVPHPARGARQGARGGRAGQPPTIPFWLGEAPARTDELSAAVSRLRARRSRRGLRHDPTGEQRAATGWSASISIAERGRASSWWTTWRRA